MAAEQTDEQAGLSRPMTTAESIAYHEIGHATVGILNGKRPKSISIAADPTADNLGQVIFDPLPQELRNAASSRTEAERFLPYIEIRLAGAAAEGIREKLNLRSIYRQLDDRPGWVADVARAQALAARATGLDDNLCLVIPGFEKQEKVVLGCLSRSRATLIACWLEVAQAASELIRHQYLGSDFIKIFSDRLRGCVASNEYPTA